MRNRWCPYGHDKTLTGTSRRRCRKCLADRARRNYAINKGKIPPTNTNYLNNPPTRTYDDLERSRRSLPQTENHDSRVLQQYLEARRARLQRKNILEKRARDQHLSTQTRSTNR